MYFPLKNNKKKEKRECESFQLIGSSIIDYIIDELELDVL